LFSDKGFRGTTTRALAAALGVTEPVLYQHFRTKRDLYTAIIEAQAQLAAERVERLRRFAATSNDAEFFRRVADLVLERFEEEPETTRLLLFTSLERHELAGLFFERLFADFYGVVSSYIRRSIQAGAFRKVNPDIAARGLIGMISYPGLVELLFTGQQGRPARRRAARQTAEIFLAGLSVTYRPEEPNPPGPLSEPANSPSDHSTTS
jgi:AcrR family transcriptional regulator